MPQCGGCGKFLSSVSGAAVCAKCKQTFHKLCVAWSGSGKVPKDWMCPCCIVEIPHIDNTNTPVKGICTELSSSNDDSKRDVDSPLACSEKSQNTFSGGDRTSDLIAEMKLIRADVQAVMHEVSRFREDMRDLREDIKICKTSVAGFAEHIGVIEKRLEVLENAGTYIAELQSTIDTLENELNDTKQETLVNDVEIVGIPEKDGESLEHVVGLLALKLGTTLDESEIVGIYRTGPRRAVVSGGSPARPRPIAVRLSRATVKQRLMRAAKVRRNIKTTDLSLAGTPSSIYINDRLTATNRKLLGKAREVARERSWKYVWPSHGKIFARKFDKEKAYHLRNEKDIFRVFGGAPSVDIRT